MVTTFYKLAPKDKHCDSISPENEIFVVLTKSFFDWSFAKVFRHLPYLINSFAEVKRVHIFSSYFLTHVSHKTFEIGEI